MQLPSGRAKLPPFDRLNEWLVDVGWRKSVEEKLPVDKAGRPLPWYTYPAISFLAPRIRKQWRVFEYGSGNSTLWWSKHACSVVACEHHEKWAGRLKDNAPENVTVVYRTLDYDGAYCRSILDQSGPFEVVVVDGRDRVNCAKQCVARLTDNGVIVWDNSNRAKYSPGFDFLKANGFRQIAFNGVGPMNGAPWSTSVFYRDRNCLDI
jgi:hypothetical protein